MAPFIHPPTHFKSRETKRNAWTLIIIAAITLFYTLKSNNNSNGQKYYFGRILSNSSVPFRLVVVGSLGSMIPPPLNILAFFGAEHRRWDRRMKIQAGQMVSHFIHVQKHMYTSLCGKWIKLSHRIPFPISTLSISALVLSSRPTTLPIHIRLLTPTPASRPAGSCIHKTLPLLLLT